MGDEWGRVQRWPGKTWKLLCTLIAAHGFHKLSYPTLTRAPYRKAIPAQQHEFNMYSEETLEGSSHSTQLGARLPSQALGLPHVGTLDRVSNQFLFVVIACHFTFRLFPEKIVSRRESNVTG